MKYTSKCLIAILTLALPAFFVAPNVSLAQVAAPGTVTDLTVSPTNSLCQTGKENLRADNISSLTQYVYVRNAAGQPLSGKSVETLGAIDGMTITPAVAVTGADGSAVFSIKSSKAGLANFLRVSVDGQQINCPQVKVMQYADANNSTIETAVTSAPADNTTEISMTVYVRDGSNNPFVDYDIGVYLETNWTGRAEDVTISPLSPQATTGGQVSFRIKSKGPGILTVTAKASDVVLAKKTTLTFSAPVTAKVSASNSSISKTSPSGSVLADDDHAASITVRVRDENGRAMANKTVTLVSPSNYVKVSVPQTTNDAGEAYFTVRSTISGTFEIGARVDDVTLTSKASVQFVKQTSANASLIQLSPTSIKSDNTETATVTVTVKDEDSSPLQGKSVSISSVPSGLNISPALATTDADGKATFTVKASTAGAYTLKAIIDSTVLTDQPTLTVTGSSATSPTTSPTTQTTSPTAPTTAATPKASNYYSSFEAVPTLLPVGKIVSFVLKLKDTSGAAIAGRNVQFLVTTNGVIKTYNVTTDTNGRGQLDITVTEPGVISTSVLVDSASFIATATVVAATPTNEQPLPTASPSATGGNLTVTPTQETVGATGEEEQPPVDEDQLPEPKAGRMIWIQGTDTIVYKQPRTLKIYVMRDADDALATLKTSASRVSNSTMDKIPAATSNSKKFVATRRFYAGRFLMTAKDQTRVWYVHPDTLKRYWFDGSSASYAFLKQLADKSE